MPHQVLILINQSMNDCHDFGVIHNNFLQLVDVVAQTAIATIQASIYAWTQRIGAIDEYHNYRFIRSTCGKIENQNKPCSLVVERDLVSVVT